MTRGRRPYLPAVFCVVLTAACDRAVAQSAGQPINPQFRELLKTYQTREEQTNPLYVKYRLTYTETVAWQRAKQGADVNKPPTGQRAKPGANVNKPPTEPLVRIDVVEYARKGEKVMMRNTHEKPPPHGGAGSWWGREFVLYDGRNAMRNSSRENEFFISKKFDNTWTAERPFTATQEEGLRRTLEQWEAGTMPTVGSRTDALEDGQAVTIVDLRYPTTKWRNRVVLARSRDYVVLRHEVFDAAGKPTHRVDVSEYREINGVPYPIKAVATHFMSGGLPGYTATYDVLEVELDPSKVPDDLFYFEVPPNAVVFDTDLKVIVRQTELTESHLNEAVRHLAPPLTVAAMGCGRGDTRGRRRRPLRPPLVSPTACRLDGCVIDHHP